MWWSQVIATDLVPGWFAMAFWLAFVTLVLVVVRDVRDAGGVRRVKAALDEAIQRRGAERRRPPETDPDAGVSDDPPRRQDR